MILELQNTAYVTSYILLNITFLPYIFLQNDTVHKAISNLGEFLGAFVKLRKATISFFMSVRPSVCLSVRLSAWHNLTPTGRILMEFDIYTFFRKFVEKIKVLLKSEKNNRDFTFTSRLQEEVFTFMTILVTFFLE
jgi:ribosome biogenesis protein Nip4